MTNLLSIRAHTVLLSYRDRHQTGTEGHGAGGVDAAPAQRAVGGPAACRQAQAGTANPRVTHTHTYMLMHTHIPTCTHTRARTGVGIQGCSPAGELEGHLRSFHFKHLVVDSLLVPQTDSFQAQCSLPEPRDLSYRFLNICRDWPQSLPQS